MNWYKKSQQNIHLPDIPSGCIRLTHFTFERAAEILLSGEDFSYKKQGSIDGTTDSFSNNEDIVQLIQSGKTGAFTRSSFGWCVVLIDMKHDEHRIHRSWSNPTPLAVDNSRICGCYNTETKSFKQNPNYNPNKPVNLVVERRLPRQTSGYPELPVPSPSDSAPSTDVF